MTGDPVLEEKAKDVGRLIGQSSEYQALKRSSEALNNDREAVALLQEMEKLRGEAQQLIQRGENPTPEMEQKLDSMLEKIQAQPAYQRAVAAQENFDKLMLRVNEWIMDGGRLIVFEGAEGAGKTTQIRLLAERLTNAGISSVGVREPGGTPVGDEIRDIVLHQDEELTAATEALLFMASRAELIAREILPSLEKLDAVLVDRFFLSTYAYQIVGRGLPEPEVRAANRLATGAR